MKNFLVFALAMAVSAFALGASDKQMAVGGWLQAGNPGEHAGLDFQMRLDAQKVIDIYGTFFFSDDENSLGVYFGYYWNFYLPVPQELGRMGFYVGPAGGLGWWFNEWGVHDEYDEMGFAFRIGGVGGYQWEFPIPLQLYLEINPVGELQFLSGERPGEEWDDVDFELPDFYFRIGLRFWF